jgi:integrase
MSRREGSITQRGKNSFRLKFDIPAGDGTRRTVTETIHAVNRSAAQKVLTARLAARDNGSWIEPSQKTLCEYLAETIAAGSYTSKIRDRYNEILRLHIQPYFGAIGDPQALPPAQLATRLAEITPSLKPVRLQDLKPAQIAAWQRAVATHSYRGRPIGPATLHQVDKVLRLGLKRATKLELIPRSPMVGVDRPKVPRKEMAILTPAQLDDLLARLAQDPREHARRLGTLAIIAAHTGARLGEIAAARWSDLDLAAGSWQVQRSFRQDGKTLTAVPCKTERSRRVVSLGPVVRGFLSRHKVEQAQRLLALGRRVGADDTVFDDGIGAPLPPHQVTFSWWRVLRQIGFTPALSFHKLRHLHASLAIGAKVDIVTVSRRLGHATVQITLDTYGHLLDNADAGAASAVEAALRRPGRPHIPTPNPTPEG